MTAKRWRAPGKFLLALFLFPLAEGRAAENRRGWFVRVDNPAVQDLLTLGFDGTYQMSSVAKGLAATKRGSFTRRGNLLTLSDAADRVPAELVQVDWGPRRYLVEPSRLATFCDFAWKAGSQPPPLFPEMVFYRPMDDTGAFPKRLPAACTIPNLEGMPDDQPFHQTGRLRAGLTPWP